MLRIMILIVIIYSWAAPRIEMIEVKEDLRICQSIMHLHKYKPYVPIPKRR